MLVIYLQNTFSRFLEFVHSHIGFVWISYCRCLDKFFKERLNNLLKVTTARNQLDWDSNPWLSASKVHVVADEENKTSQTSWGMILKQGKIEVQ